MESEVEHQLIVSRLSERTSSSRIEGLELLRDHLKRNNGILRFKDKESIFKGLSLSLEDTSWKIRHLTIELLRDMIPKFGDELDDLYAPMLPQLIENIGDNKVEIRKDVVQTLHTYMRNSLNVGFLLQLYLEFGLQSEDEKVQKESIINLPLLMSAEFANEDLFEISQTLLGKIPGHDEPRSIWRCIDRLKMVVGEERFESYVSHMNRDMQTIYQQKPYATPNSTSQATPSETPPVQTPHSTLTARELAAKLTAASKNDLDNSNMFHSSGKNSSRWLEFGIVKPDVMIKLTNRDDWQLRLHGIEDLKTDVTQLSDISNLKPDLVEFIAFLCRFLTDEVNFKITMSTLEIFVVLIKKLGTLSCEYVEPLTAALSHRLGDSKIVIRQLNSRAFRELMYTATPMPVLEQILPCLKHRNSRVREETVNVIISALLTFPTTDFDFTTLCDTIAPCLADPKRRVRQSSLEVFAVLAQLMGVNNLKPLIRAIEMLEPEFGEGPMNAIKARVARRQLPMIKENGMVDYATSIVTSSAISSVAGSAASSAAKSRSYSSNRQSPPSSVPQSASSSVSTASQYGADIDWILKASGSSRGGNLPGDPGNTSLIQSTASESVASESVPSSATERRAVVLSSAGKKLPWDQHQPPTSTNQISNTGNARGGAVDSTDHLPNGFKKPLIPPSKNRNNFANRTRAYNSEELESSNLSSGYISMRNTARPHSDTSDASSLHSADSSLSSASSINNTATYSSFDLAPLRQNRARLAHPRPTPAKMSPNKKAALYTAADHTAVNSGNNSSSSGFHSGFEASPFLGRGSEGFPTKPQLARSATSRDQKGLKMGENSNGQPTDGTTDDLPIDDKALSSVRNSAAKKKAEKRTNTADSPYKSGENVADVNNTLQNQDSKEHAQRNGHGHHATSSNRHPVVVNGHHNSNALRGGHHGHEAFPSSSDKLDLENLPVETLQQKVEMYTAVRKSYNPQLYKDPQAEDDDLKYKSAPLDNFYAYNAAGDPYNQSRAAAAAMGAGDSSVTQQQQGEMSGFTRRKIEDLKEKRKKERDERRNSNQRGGGGGTVDTSKPPKGREEAWVVDANTETSRTSLGSAPTAGKHANSNQQQQSINPQQNHTSQSSQGPKHKSSLPDYWPNSAPKGGAQVSHPSSSSSSSAQGQYPPHHLNHSQHGNNHHTQTPQLRSTPDVELRRAMSLVQNQDWGSKCEGIALLSVLSEKYPEVLGAQMHDVNLAVVAEVKNLRSQVAREAIKLMRTLFKNLEKRMDLDLELTVGCLLNKTGESSGFIRDDVEKALTTMAEKTTPNRSIAAISVNSSHKSKEVRKTASYILCIILERILDPSRGVKNTRENISQAIGAIATFSLDSAPEARFYGKKMLWLLMQDDANYLDVVLQKSVQPSNVHPLRKLMETLRNNGGPGEHPNETPSAKLARKPSYNNRTFSGGSVRLDSMASESELMQNGTYPPPSQKSNNSNKGVNSRGGGGGHSLGRFNEDDKECVRTLCSNLKSNDFREREAAIHNLVELSSDRADLVGSNINLIFDEYVHRLTDSNSKVNLLALQSMLKLVPLLRDNFSIVPNMVVPAVAQNMASNRPELRNLSLDIIDAMIDHIDQTSLLQPLSTLARYGNNRVRPDIILKLATLVTHMYPRKPQMVIRHVLPVLWQLVGNLSGSGAVPGSSTNLRQAAQRLATNLYSFMGQNLIDMAENEFTTPRNLLTLKQLVEVS
ncbi:TOG array regulator of axonemal microtubules protein 1-like isoform X2 [Convolutriloba macropyga]|uniref:TOG array regulator of axonemal microtubules protein 1-like isoform X2 n=1 Tax=Convolutriloba macropyga TaxID=536237 RepID=UPI003F52004E